MRARMIAVTRSLLDAAEQADEGAARLFDRAVFALLAWSQFTVAATSLVPLKVVVWSVDSPVFLYTAGVLCLAAAFTLNRWVVAAAGLWSVFVTVNRAFGFLELYNAGQTNLAGSMTQQVVLGYLTVHAVVSVVAKPDKG